LSTAFAARQPPSDANEPNNGGDGRLDIVLIDVDVSETVPYEKAKACTSPAFILLQRTASISDVAHEVMHAFQHSYAYAQDCASYHWLKEATATWAEDFVYPAVDQEHGSSLAFLSQPEKSLETSEGEFGRSHEYGAYLLPFFLTCISGPCDHATRPTYSPYLQVAWDNTERSDSLTAINDALPRWRHNLHARGLGGDTEHVHANHAIELLGRLRDGHQRLRLAAVSRNAAQDTLRKECPFRTSVPLTP